MFIHETDSLCAFTPQPRELTAGELGWDEVFARHVPRLYAAGDTSLLERPMVALVGSRRASREGRARAEQLARALVAEGVVVMSGLALGIDAAAHRAALAHGGRTVAVIGTALEQTYPAEHTGLQALLSERHLVLSPFAPGSRTALGNFPLRNRVMARLALATVVIEAGNQSGTRHQIEECLRVGRTVWLPRAVAENPATSWPAQYLGRSLVRVFDDASEGLASVARTIG